MTIISPKYSGVPLSANGRPLPRGSDAGADVLTYHYLDDDALSESGQSVTDELVTRVLTQSEDADGNRNRATINDGMTYGNAIRDMELSMLSQRKDVTFRFDFPNTQQYKNIPAGIMVISSMKGGAGKSTLASYVADGAIVNGKRQLAGTATKVAWPFVSYGEAPDLQIRSSVDRMEYGGSELVPMLGVLNEQLRLNDVVVLDSLSDWLLEGSNLAKEGVSKTSIRWLKSLSTGLAAAGKLLVVTMNVNTSNPDVYQAFLDWMEGSVTSVVNIAESDANSMNLSVYTRDVYRSKPLIVRVPFKHAQKTISKTNPSYMGEPTGRRGLF